MATIVKYKVGVARAARGGAVRWLILKLAEPEGNLGQVSLFFYEGETPGLGFANRNSGFVVANLPIADFEPTYRILNGERPVFVTWRLDHTEERLISIDVSTSDEPPGEGPVDQSP
jgi:hypothetical protein